MEAALLGLRKSYREACQAKKALGLFFATLFLLTQVNIAPAQAKLSGELLEPNQTLECAEDGADSRTIEKQNAPLHKFVRQCLAKAKQDNGYYHDNYCVLSADCAPIRLVFFYTTSKFATFDIKLRKSRDPPSMVQ